MIKKYLPFVFVLLAYDELFGQQTIGGWKDEKSLYAETKQVNQFFRRFNNEEAVDGSRYYNGKDSLYRDPKTRPKYLRMLFDNENLSISKEIKNTFVTDVANTKNQKYLDFHGGKWFAEVKIAFWYHGKQEDLNMFLHIQDAKIGSKWVISSIQFAPYIQQYEKDTSDSKYFLHPLSHEVDFINMNKIFEHNAKNIFEYTSSTFKVDQLTLFCEDVKAGRLKFSGIQNVKLHFFQIDGWYFELNKFNRSGNNTGWLISSITKANESEKNIMEAFIKNRHE